MEKLRIYRIRDGYVAYLHGIDHRVQFNKGERRPYLGVVLEIGPHKYFVPMESPKPNHVNIKGGVHIMRIDGGKYGLLGFNNMIPAKDFFLVPFDIAGEPDEQYRNLLWNQLNFCNDHREEIREHARKTYDGVTAKRIPFYCASAVISRNWKRNTSNIILKQQNPETQALGASPGAFCRSGMPGRLFFVMGAEVYINYASFTMGAAGVARYSRRM